MIRALILFLTMLATPAAAQALREVRLDDGRFYLIALPEGVARPPLILALHGGGGDPRQFARDTGLAARAVRAGFAVAFPAGTSRRGGDRLLVWNAGYCCGHAPGAGVDDLAFLDRVARDAARLGADAGRLYLTGMSNGAMMAQTYAATRPDRTAAVVSVAGTLDLSRFAVRGRVALLHIHGTDDRHVPYAGGVGDKSLARADFTAVAAVMDAFRAPWGRLARQESVIDPVPDGMRTRLTEWRDPRGRVRLALMTVEGGGHDWPGGRRSDRRGATRDIDAGTEAIRFFVQNR
jgi:polyhydroxybutyrate depolymerase